MAYEWRPGARFPVEADIVGERLSELGQQNEGRITPALVVEDARPEDAPLHPCFEWSDPQAAQLYREEQARLLIRSVRVVVRDESKSEPVAVRAFLHVADPQGPTYMDSAQVMRDELLRTQVLQRAWAELNAWRDRYKEMQELAGIFEVIEDVQRKQAS